jgi:hypothetical protein
MPKLLAFTLLFLITCNDQLEKDFFPKYSRADRIARLLAFERGPLWIVPTQGL